MPLFGPVIVVFGGFLINYQLVRFPKEVILCVMDLLATGQLPLLLLFNSYSKDLGSGEGDHNLFSLFSPCPLLQQD